LLTIETLSNRHICLDNQKSSRRSFLRGDHSIVTKRSRYLVRIEALRVLVSFAHKKALATSIYMLYYRLKTGEGSVRWTRMHAACSLAQVWKCWNRRKIMSGLIHGPDGDTKPWIYPCHGWLSGKISSIFYRAKLGIKRPTRSSDIIPGNNLGLPSAGGAKSPKVYMLLLLLVGALGTYPMYLGMIVCQLCRRTPDETQAVTGGARVLVPYSQ
jgi:hypothetical protein